MVEAVIFWTWCLSRISAIVLIVRDFRLSTHSAAQTIETVDPDVDDSLRSVKKVLACQVAALSSLSRIPVSIAHELAVGVLSILSLTL